jgi:hypothetical protein
MLHVDALIEAAIARGELSGLPGEGKPLNLDDDRFVPEEHRLAFRVLKNAGLVPPEVELSRRLGELRERHAAATTEEERAALAVRIATEESHFRMRLERFRG